MLDISEYFEGKVKSIGFASASAGRASVGVMEAGEYAFGTGQPEEMTVVSGALTVLLPGETEWRYYEPGDKFNVPGHSEFHLQVAEPSAYLCRYLKEQCKSLLPGSRAEHRHDDHEGTFCAPVYKKVRSASAAEESCGTVKKPARTHPLHN